MDSLPNELLVIIFNFVNKITDKRLLLRTCTRYNTITKELITCAEKNFRIKYKSFINYYCVEKFTQELCHDEYFYDIPQKYFNANNSVLMGLLARYGNLYKLKYAIQNKCSLSVVVCEMAAQYGHLDVIIWAQEFGMFTRRICSIAATFGHLNIIKWAKSDGYTWDENVCENAALNGHLNILKWARENGCDLNPDICSKAALNGHLNILKWARENGCNWNSAICTNAALNGRLEILKWAIANGCDLEIGICTTGALLYGHLNILNWLKENGYY